MTTYWRNAGLSYLQYSAWCARYFRRALKPEVRAKEIEIKESTTIRSFRWKEGKAATEAEYYNKRSTST